MDAQGGGQLDPLDGLECLAVCCGAGHVHGQQRQGQLTALLRVHDGDGLVRLGRLKHGDEGEFDSLGGGHLSWRLAFSMVLAVVIVIHFRPFFMPSAAAFATSSVYWIFLM